MPKATPKFKSGEFKSVLAELKSVFDAHSLGVVLFDALDRKSAEQIVGRFAKGAVKARLKAVPKTELVGQVTGWFFESDEVAYQVIKEMDRSCQKERHIVASIPEEHAEERVGSYRAIALKRERAKFVWGLARDEREVIRGLANKVILDFFQGVADQERAKDALSGDASSLGEDVELARRIQAQAQQLSEAANKMSVLETQVTKFETERARLMAEIGGKQRNLVEATEAREDLETQLQSLQEQLEDVEIKEREAADARSREQEALAMAEDLQRKVRRLEKLAGASSSLSETQDALDAALRKNEELGRQTQRLEQSHKKERESLESERNRLRAELTQMREELRTARSRIAQIEPLLPADASEREGDGNRLVVLLDQANLAVSARSGFGKKVDFGAVLEQVRGDRDLKKAVAFIVDNGGDAFENFCELLKKTGWELRIKKPKRFKDGQTKADWDLGMAMEAVELADRADTVVLVTGDGDFAPVVRHLKKRGLSVEVAAFPESLASELENVADRAIRLDSGILERA